MKNELLKMGGNTGPLNASSPAGNAVLQGAGVTVYGAVNPWLIRAAFTGVRAFDTHFAPVVYLLRSPTPQHGGKCEPGCGKTQSVKPTSLTQLPRS